MRRLSLILVLIVGCAVLTHRAARNPGCLNEELTAITRPRVTKHLASMPLAFEKNVGQADDATEFVARGEGYFVSVGGGEAALSVGKSPDTLATVRMKPWRGNNKARVRPERKLRGQISYFLGNDPKQWRVGVPTYGAVRWEAVYPGIDLVYYGAQRQLEYDFIVQPGADPSRIGLDIAGEQALELDQAGNLLIHTAGETITQHRPIVYQDTARGRREIKGAYRLARGEPVRFDLGDYDHSLPLVIDPVIAVSTYLGGTGDDAAQSIVVKDEGIAYVSGETIGVGFPTLGQYPRPNGWDPSTDVFVTKLDTRLPGSDALIYSAYLGSADLDLPGEEGLAVDSFGAAYITGQSYEQLFPSRTFPVVNGYQTNQPNHDAFVAKLDSTSSGAAALVYSTYLGGGSEDAGSAIEVDDSGRAYVTGWTHSNNFPKLGEIAGDQSSYEAFVTVLDTQASGAASLLYSTYLSGSFTSSFGHDIFLDGAGTVWITGSVDGANFPSINSYQSEQPGTDAFVARVDPNQTGAASLLYGTYLGGSGNDTGAAITQDASGLIYVVGYTDSANFPTANAYQGDQAGRDMFLAKLDPQVSGAGALVYSTYLGGGSIDTGLGIAVQSPAAVYVAGTSNSTDFPTRNALMTDPGDGDYDAILAKIDTTSAGDSSLVYSTYLGGNLRDAASSVAVDVGGTVFLCGFTRSTDFPITSNALQTAKLGSASSTEAFLTVLEPNALLPAPSDLSASAIVNPIAIDLVWADNTPANDGYYVEYRLTGASEWTRIATLGDVTSWRHEGLGVTVVTSYDYRVQAYTGSEESYFSNRATATTLDFPPSAPSGLTITVPAAPDGETKLNLSWTDGSANETGFKIERKSGSSTFAEIDQVAAGETHYTDSNLTQDTYYTYRVRAFNSGGNSNYTSQVSGATMLAAPTIVGGFSSGSTRVLVAWQDKSTTESGFRIERKQGSGGFAQVATVSANSNEIVNTGLTPDTAYTYRVRAYRAGKQSEYSQELLVRTPPLPAPPSALSAVAVGSTRIDLTWMDNSNDETGFKVERKSGAGSFATIVTLGPNRTSYSSSALAASTNYRFRIRAYRTVDHSLYSNEANATTLGPVAAPSSLSATAVGSKRVDLSWADNSSDEDGFKVERKLGVGSYSVVATLGANVTSYSNLGLSGGATYTYRVRAYRGSDSSPFSNEALATTLPLPSPPSNLTASVISSTRIDLAWTDNSGDESGFKIERKTGAGTYTTIAQVPANTTTYKNSGLAAGTEYTYRVRAYRSSDFSTYSNERSATTP